MQQEEKESLLKEDINAHSTKYTSDIDTQQKEVIREPTEGNNNNNINCIYGLFPKLLPCIPERYILSFLFSSGLCVVYALRVNLSIALVEMVNHTVGEPPNVTYQVSYNNCNL